MPAMDFRDRIIGYVIFCSIAGQVVESILKTCSRKNTQFSGTSKAHLASVADYTVNVD